MRAVDFSFDHHSTFFTLSHIGFFFNSSYIYSIICNIDLCQTVERRHVVGFFVCCLPALMILWAAICMIGATRAVYPNVT